MAASRLPIMPTLGAAYRDWQRLMLPPRSVVVSAFLILLAVAVVTEFVPKRLWDNELSGDVLDLVQDAFEAFLLTPVLIAVHRFVILGEPTPGYALDVGNPAFRSFFFWLFILKVALGLPLTLLGLLQASDVTPFATLVPFVVSLIVVVALALRLTMLWPAIAVAVSGAVPMRAFSDTRGQTLRILAIYVLALLPWVLLMLGVAALLGSSIRVAGSLAAMVDLLIGGVVQTAILVLSAVIASRVFMVLAAQVKHAA